MSSTVASMRTNMGTLSTAIDAYRKKQDEAFAKKIEAKIEITNAKKNLKELEKAIEDQTEGALEAYQKQIQNIAKMETNVKMYTDQISDAQKAIRNLNNESITTTTARINNNASITNTTTSNISSGAVDNNTTSNASSSAVNNNATTGAVENIAIKSAVSNIASIASTSLSNNLNQASTSMFGNTVGNQIASIFGGALMGAAAGSIAGPVGAAVGAAVGGLSGAIDALTAQIQRDDDYFRTEVREIYNYVKNTQAESLQNGIISAGQRESDLISFGTMLGDDQRAKDFVVELQQFAAYTPYESDNLLKLSKKMLSFGYKDDEILPNLTKIGDASSALGIDSQNQEWVVTALGRMQTTNKTTLEYINMLSERAIPAVEYLADHYNWSISKTYENISEGLISGTKAAEIIVNRMGADFEGNMAKQSATYEGLASTISDINSQIDMAMGEGYTTKRKEGMVEEIEQMNNGYKDMMIEANRLIGEFQADLENQYQQSIIQATEDAMNSDAYKLAMRKEDGAEMGRIMAEARAKAEVDYKSSEGYQLMVQSDLDLIQNVQQTILQSGTYVDFGRQMADEFSKGWSGAIKDMQAAGLFDVDVQANIITSHGNLFQKVNLTTENALENLTGNTQVNRYVATAPTTEYHTYNNAASYATGINYVPYDRMPAILHEGEAVLTATEAQHYRTFKNQYNATYNQLSANEPIDFTPFLEHSKKVEPTSSSNTLPSIAPLTLVNTANTLTSIAPNNDKNNHEFNNNTVISFAQKQQEQKQNTYTNITKNKENEQPPTTNNTPVEINITVNNNSAETYEITQKIVSELKKVAEKFGGVA